MNLKNRVGEAVKQCVTSKGVIPGVSLYVTKKGAIKKELSKKDEKYAHVHTNGGKLNVDYVEKPKTEAAKPEQKKPKAEAGKGDKTSKA
jgi:hypothetical protein